jgi:hypothetical protein
LLPTSGIAQQLNQIAADLMEKLKRVTAGDFQIVAGLTQRGHLGRLMNLRRG